MSSNNRSMDNSAVLTNTNLGLEASRAENTETLISESLKAYIAANDISVSTIATTVTSNNASTIASLSTLTNDLAAAVAQAVKDEATTLAEQTRASAAEQVLTGSVNDLISSRTTDETTIASLVASRTSDQAQIVSASQAIVFIRGTLVADEASSAAEIVRATGAEAGLASDIATANASIASLSATQTVDEASLASEIARATGAESSLQSAVSALATSITTTAITAGSISSSSISSTGPLVLSSTGDAYGTAVITLNNGNDCNGMQLDTGGLSTNPDLADFVIKTVDRTMLMRFEGRSANLVDQSNAAIGELSFSSGQSGSRPATTFYTGAASSGLAQGDFTVKAGVVTDKNDQDVTLKGTWSNFGDYAADVRLVRKGNVVTASLLPFTYPPDSNVSAATYSLSVPSWAVPVLPIECCIVVSTNGLPSVGCCGLNAQNAFFIFPFNGNWGSTGGLNMISAFSYLVGGPSETYNPPPQPEKYDASKDASTQATKPDGK